MCENGCPGTGQHIKMAMEATNGEGNFEESPHSCSVENNITFAYQNGQLLPQYQAGYIPFQSQLSANLPQQCIMQNIVQAQQQGLTNLEAVQQQQVHRSNTGVFPPPSELQNTEAEQQNDKMNPEQLGQGAIQRTFNAPTKKGRYILKRNSDSSEVLSDKRQKRSQTEVNQTLYNVPVGNRFGPLDNVEENDDSELKAVKIPPIIIQNYNKRDDEFLNYKLLKEDIVKNEIENFEVKYSNNKFKVQFYNIDDFRKFRKFCENNEIEFYSFKDPSVKAFEVVIKDVPECLDVNEIKNELNDTYPVLKVVRLYGKNRKPLQIVAVDVENNVAGRAILKLNKLDCCVVRVFVRTKTKLPIQCKNCQRFGHTQANCHNNPRCVKCLNDHHYSKCTLPKSGVQPSCANCKQNHTANYRGCSFYQAELNKKFNKPVAGSRSNEVQGKALNSSQSVDQGTRYESRQARYSQPPVFNVQQFPPLPERPGPWTRPLNNSQNTFRNTLPYTNQAIDVNRLIESITSTVITQIMNLLLPQIQNMIQVALQK